MALTCTGSNGSMFIFGAVSSDLYSAIMYFVCCLLAFIDLFILQYIEKYTESHWQVLTRAKLHYIH